MEKNWVLAFLAAIDFNKMVFIVMYRTAGLLALTAIAFLAGISVAHADLVEKFSDKILNECGVVAAITSGLAIYFARLATKNRDGWDIDRDGLIKMMIANNDRDAKAIAIYSKIEGMLVAAQAKHS